MRRILILLLVTTVACVRDLHAESRTVQSHNQSTGNQVTITTPIGFKFGDAIWVPNGLYTNPPTVPAPTQFKATIAATAGANWRVVGTVPTSVMVGYGGSGYQLVASVAFEERNTHPDPDGTYGYHGPNDLINVSVFEFGVTISSLTSGMLSPPTEYTKRDAFKLTVGTDALGVLQPAQANNTLTASIQFNGLVVPSGLGVTPGGLTIPFKFVQNIVKRRIYYNGQLAPNFSADNSPDIVDPGLVTDKPTATNNIHFADAPGIPIASIEANGTQPIGTTLEEDENFVQWVELNGIQCSPVYLWYVKTVGVKTKSGWINDTTKASIGSGNPVIKP